MGTLLALVVGAALGECAVARGGGGHGPGSGLAAGFARGTRDGGARAAPGPFPARLSPLAKL